MLLMILISFIMQSDLIDLSLCIQIFNLFFLSASVHEDNG